MSTKEDVSLKERLERRRRSRNRRLVEKNSVDQSEILSTNPSPTTQSLDRKSSKQIISTSSQSQKFSSQTISQSSTVPSIERISSKPTHSTDYFQSVSIDTKKDSVPISIPTEISHLHYNEESVIVKENVPVMLPVITSAEKHISISNEKQVVNQEPITSIVSSETLPVINPSEKSIASQEPIKSIVSSTNTPLEKSNTNSNDTSIITQIPVASTPSPTTLNVITPSDKSNPSSSEKLIVKQESVATIVRPTILEKSPPISPDIHEYSIANQNNKSESHPSTAHHQFTNSNDPIFQSKPLIRTISEQILPRVKYKHQPIDSTIAKQNSLALPYLFNKRLVKTQLPHTESLNSDQPYRKTVWE